MPLKRRGRALEGGQLAQTQDIDFLVKLLSLPSRHRARTVTVSAETDSGRAGERTIKTAIWGEIALLLLDVN